MPAPQNDLFEVTINLDSGRSRVLVRVFEQKPSFFRVQVGNDLSNIDLSTGRPDRHGELTFIGSDFPESFEPKCLGNLGAYLEERIEYTRSILTASAVRCSALTIARAVALMEKDKSIGAHLAIAEAREVGCECVRWVAATNAAVETARNAIRHSMKA